MALVEPYLTQWDFLQHAEVENYSLHIYCVGLPSHLLHAVNIKEKLLSTCDSKMKEVSTNNFSKYQYLDMMISNQQRWHLTLRISVKKS